MIVVEDTGEVIFCNEADIVGDYVFADMIVIPLKNVFEIWEENT